MKPQLNYYKFNSYNMMKILLFHIFFFISFSSAQLYQVFALTRHGARYHTRAFYDGNDTQSLWGQLTSVGMKQLYNFGRLIRKQYVDNIKLLSPKYNSQEIQVYSTLVNRTIMSGSSFLYGLYPLGTGPILPSTDTYLHKPPYSYSTDIQLQRNALPQSFQQIKVVSNESIILTDCPNYEKFKDINFQMISDIVNEMNTTYYPFLKRMSTLFNFSMSSASLYIFTKCYDDALVNNYLGRPQPSNFTNNDYENLRYLTNWYYSVAMSQNNSLMDNTFKLQRLMKHFQMRIKYPKSYPLKWTHLFGHDTDIIALHLALNTTSADCIQQLHRQGRTKYTECEVGSFDFASNILIELHSQNQIDFFVKVRSNGKYLKVCNKSYICSYKEFKSLIQKSISKISMDVICGIKIKRLPSKQLQNYKQRARLVEIQ